MLVKWLQTYNIPPRIVREEITSFWKQGRKFRKPTDFDLALREACTRRLFATRDVISDEDMVKIFKQVLKPVYGELARQKREIEKLKKEVEKNKENILGKFKRWIQRQS